MRSTVIVCLTAFLVMIATYAVYGADETVSLINTPARPWQLEEWINSEPIGLDGLKGKVILVRFWTAPFCPYCINTAPALNEFYEEYHDRGLEVVGLYTHKRQSKISKEKVEGYVKRFGFRFPVAIDRDLKTLKAWWLGPGNRPWSSVSFLIDRKGVIRYIHPGGQYRKGDGDYNELKQWIERLLRE